MEPHDDNEGAADDAEAVTSARELATEVNNAVFAVVEVVAPAMHAALKAQIPVTFSIGAVAVIADADGELRHARVDGRQAEHATGLAWQAGLLMAAALIKKAADEDLILRF